MLAFIARLGGRKFIMALFAVLAVALSSSLGISEESVMALGGIVCAYVLSQGFADGLSKGATSTTPTEKGATVTDRLDFPRSYETGPR